MFDLSQFTVKDILFYIQQYADTYAFLVPLGVIGLWRWSVWSMKEIIGSNYKPKTQRYRAGVSIITPVYNETPEVFSAALASWVKNNPDEIIAVIDHSDKKCITIFKAFAKKYPFAVMVITHKPGKRPALADGIRKATKEIVALVDSDTIWDDDVIKNGLPPFHDEKVAGVATYQSVLKPKTFAQKIFDVQLDLRYMHEYPFLAAAGDALVCLSGRTAFYRREILNPMLPELENEMFMGKPVISGDDKCLTYLVLAAGWKVAYQSNSHVYTPGMADIDSYLKQRLRWSRNSLRSDLKALLNGWPRQHSALLFFQIDKVLQSFVVILSPIFFIIALVYNEWVVAGIIFIWWFVSRTIKMYSHLLQKPRNITIIPGFVLFSFLSGIMKIYALFTLNTQGWITRWDKSRMQQLKFLNDVPAYAGTGVIILALFYGVHLYKQHTYYIPHAKKDMLIASALQKFNGTLAMNPSVLGTSTELDKDYSVKKYVTEQNETIDTIAKKFAIEPRILILANSSKIPYVGMIFQKGTIISIPGRDVTFDPLLNLPYSTEETNPLIIRYDSTENTIVVMGRSHKVNLHDLQQRIPAGLISEISPGIWHTSASIFIHHGATLILDKSEVSWMKLESNKERFTNIRALSGDILINGVKITSWDSTKDDYDQDITDGRSFIMAKDNARMDVKDSEIAYLGFATSPELTVSPYGISWKMSGLKLKQVLLTGIVVNSKFHHNYFGAYTYGATGMLWNGNEFYDNIRYGLDPHDDSNGFIVEENYSHDNGTHGIIFSKRCIYNIIRNNVSINNGIHGIMLHEMSNHNIVTNNTLEGNTSGVSLWQSSNNIVRDNIIRNNKHGIRANNGSNDNVMENNTINNSDQYGFYLYEAANNNRIQNNTLENNAVGVYIKSQSNFISNNKLTNNDVGIYFLDNAANNNASNNEINQSAVYAIYTKIDSNLKNVLGDNILHRNKKDIEGQDIEE
jgi:hyaluronan synthase